MDWMESQNSSLLPAVETDRFTALLQDCLVPVHSRRAISNIHYLKFSPRQRDTS